MRDSIHITGCLMGCCTYVAFIFSVHKGHRGQQLVEMESSLESTEKVESQREVHTAEGFTTHLSHIDTAKGSTTHLSHIESQEDNLAKGSTTHLSHIESQDVDTAKVFTTHLSHIESRVKRGLEEDWEAIYRTEVCMLLLDC